MAKAGPITATVKVKVLMNEVKCMVCGEKQTDLEYIVWGHGPLVLRIALPVCDEHTTKDLLVGDIKAFVAILEVE